jgi:integrase
LDPLGLARLLAEVRGPRRVGQAGGLVLLSEPQQPGQRAGVGVDLGARVAVGLRWARTVSSRSSAGSESARTVPIPRELALILIRHEQRSRYTGPEDFVFATRTGRLFGQRNVARALRRAQFNAKGENGDPTFGVLHEVVERGESVPVPHGLLPSMHSFRHTVACRALLAGESVDEVAFLLGHRDANVTRAVYVRELSDARRRTMRRSRMTAEFGELLKLD